MDEETLELIHALQIQQININQKMMEEWSIIGELIAEMLDTNQKILAILKKEAENEGYD